MNGLEELYLQEKPKKISQKAVKELREDTRY